MQKKTLEEACPEHKYLQMSQTVGKNTNVSMNFGDKQRKLNEAIDKIIL